MIEAGVPGLDRLTEQLRQNALILARAQQQASRLGAAAWRRADLLWPLFARLPGKE